MGFPAFFSEVAPIRTHDALAQLLGASDDGIIEYHYADAVRLAGHSCPTVASAWLSARAALRHLYPDATPERGNISIYLDGAEDAGVTGVVGQVLTLVTGAAAGNGFHGLGGRHARRNLLHYAQHDAGSIRYRRNDTGAEVDVDIDTSGVPGDPLQRVFMQLVMTHRADAAQRREFGRLWQDRVRRILIEHADDPAVVRVHALA